MYRKLAHTTLTLLMMGVTYSVSADSHQNALCFTRSGENQEYCVGLQYGAIYAIPNDRNSMNDKSYRLYRFGADDASTLQQYSNPGQPAAFPASSCAQLYAPKSDDIWAASPDADCTVWYKTISNTRKKTFRIGDRDGNRCLTIFPSNNRIGVTACAYDRHPYYHNQVFYSVPLNN